LTTEARRARRRYGQRQPRIARRTRIGFFYLRFGLRPARKPSAEWNRNILLSLRGVAGCQRKSKDPPGQNQAGWGTHFKIVCWLESRRVGHPRPDTENPHPANERRDGQPTSRLIRGLRAPGGPPATLRLRSGQASNTDKRTAKKGNRGLRGGCGSSFFICASAYGLSASLRQRGMGFRYSPFQR
jgi:hypothetical protein